MEKSSRKTWLFGVFLVLMLFAAGFTFTTTTVETQAATTTGFEKVGNSIYYYKNGKKVTGWICIAGKKYYMDPNKGGAATTGWTKSRSGYLRYYDRSTGALSTGFTKADGKWYYFDRSTGFSKSGFIKMGTGYRYFYPSKFYAATGWVTNTSKTKTYYFKTNGYMVTGLVKIGSDYYYFDSKGVMQKGLVTAGGYTRYFNTSTGKMVSSTWIKDSSGQVRYFSKNGSILKGLQTVSPGYNSSSSGTYWFNYQGVAAKGWVTVNGSKYYFDSSTYKAVTGTVVIGGKTMQFDSSGKYQKTVTINTSNSSSVNYAYFSNDPKPVSQTGTKTLKNYLAGALKPVGQALYVWGGGWTDSTRVGVSSTMQKWYLTQSSSYNYKNYMDLTTANRVKGFDCSGFVGWAAYQTLRRDSTVYSGDIGNLYKNRGWGTIVNQNYLSQTDYKLCAGDVGYNPDHTWIVLGQCSDKSAVIVHSTPQAGVQISGTTTPSGNYDSQAVSLATKYMSKYAGYKKYDYHTSSGKYILRGSYLRWNTSTLSDPDGFRNMTADKILKALFGF